ncbi:MAG: hypothetical protein HGB35_08980 [Geobacteraceae bacterium]|nr:hypothetical protein [Geobacteraceae bacterium]
MESVFLSDVDQLFTKKAEVQPLDSSWALMKKDMKKYREMAAQGKISLDPDYKR